MILTIRLHFSVKKIVRTKWTKSWIMTAEPEKQKNRHNYQLILLIRLLHGFICPVFEVTKSWLIWGVFYLSRSDNLCLRVLLCAQSLFWVLISDKILVQIFVVKRLRDVQWLPTVHAVYFIRNAVYKEDFGLQMKTRICASLGLRVKFKKPLPKIRFLIK